MANFNVDTTGNLWIGTNVSDTFSTAQGQTATKFYVENDGTIKAEEGTVGGIVLASDHIKSSNYSATSGQEAGFRINSNGDAVFNDVTIRGDLFGVELKGGMVFNGGDIKTSTTGTRVEILDNNGIEGEIRFETSTGTTARLVADAATEFAVEQAALSGGKIKLVTGATSDGLQFTGNEVNFTTPLGSNNPVIKLNGTNANSAGTSTLSKLLGVDSSGRLAVGSSSSGVSSISVTGELQLSGSGGILNINHNDSDHDDQYYTKASVNTLLAAKDNYGSWTAKAGGNNMTVNSGFGVEWKAGTGISLSVNTSPYEITINNTATGSSGVTSVNRTISSSSDGRFMRQTGLQVTGTTLNYYLSTRGDDLTIDDARPSSNQASDFGISTNEYDTIHADTGQFTIVYGANLGSSSQNIKKDISDLSLGLDFINALEPKSYKYKEQLYGADDKLGFGLIAEDVSTVLDTFNVSNTKLLKEPRTDYKYYGQCAHELICTCEDPECCPEPMLIYDRETEEWTEVEGCDKNAKCTMPCCTDIAGATIDGVNFVHASEEECELEFIDARKHESLKYDELIAPLVKAVQELSTQISDLTARIEVLEG